MVSRLLLPSLLAAAALFTGALPASAAFTRSAGSPLPLPAGSAPQGVAVGDFNGDGNPDIATANMGTNRVSLLLGNASGGFAAVRNFVAGNSPAGLVAGDFNDDGDLDLAVTNNTTPGRVTILFGNDDGAFPDSASHTVGSNPLGIVSDDFNSDGFPDLAVANSGDGSVSILRGSASGAFSPHPDSPFSTDGALPQLLTVGDFDRDGKADLATANTGDNSVSVLLGNGGGGFSHADGSPFFAGAVPVGIAAGDIDGDGRADLVVSNAVNQGEVTLLFGDGTGGFPQWDVLPVGSHPTDLKIADFTGDGKLDILTANHGSDNVSLLAGRGNGVFVPAVQTPAGAGPLALASGDFNRDSDRDVAITNNLGDAVTVLLQGPSDTIAPTTTATLSPAANAAGWHRGEVRVTLTAVDNAGGSGVESITYSATGAQPIAVRTVEDDQVSFVIDTEGVTVIRFFATDSDGNVEAPKTVTVRIDLTDPALTASATPTTLWPPNGKLVTVTVTGRVTDNLSGVARNSGRYTVDDEYGTSEPSGSFAIAADGTYRFTVQLPAKRSGRDRDGRTFTINVTALDIAGNAGEASTQVVVPHDRRRKKNRARN